MNRQRGVRALCLCLTCTLAVAPGCESDDAWRMDRAHSSARWSGGQGVSFSGGWEEAAILLGPVVVLYIGSAVIDGIKELWEQGTFEWDSGVAWDSKEGRALRRMNDPAAR